MSGNKSKKKIMIFIALMAGCGLAGGALGFLLGSTENTDYVRNIIKTIKANGLIPSALIFASVNILFCIISLTKYFKAKKKFNLISKDDDDEYIAVEQSLNLPTLLAGILAIFNITMLPVIVYFAEYSSFPEKYMKLFVTAIVIIYIAFLLFSFLLSRSIVELLKKINPEKKGDLFDLNFQKSWENSCDEAQKMIMYKAAYKSFNTVKYTCLVLWVICLVSQLIFKTGILPGICVGIIFTSSTISYSKEVVKLEKQ